MICFWCDKLLVSPHMDEYGDEYCSQECLLHARRVRIQVMYGSPWQYEQGE